MGLGITQASIVSSVADMTGDDSPDAVVKIKRLINERGHDFCNLANWKFLREDISFSLDTSGFKFSGASILPATYKGVVKSYLLDGTTRYPFTEKPIQMAYEWPNPSEHEGRPEWFVVTRNENDFWEIQTNRKPDQTYTVYMEIEKQWVDVTASVDTLITKQYSGAFSHYVAMARLRQQGDLESLMMFKSEWHDPRNMGLGILDRALATNTNVLQKKGTRVLRGPIDSHEVNPRNGHYSYPGHDFDQNLDNSVFFDFGDCY